MLLTQFDYYISKMVLTRYIRFETFFHISKSRLSTVSAQPEIKLRKQVKIPCPWGHISGVWWGPEDVQPVLAVHGWLDNSGSWKSVANHLIKDNISLLALDLPGTGKSSHLPPFYNYHFSGSAAILRRVQKYFNFKDLFIFGHSGGSASAFLFSALYPDVVKGYLAVDYLLYSYKRESARADATGEVLDEYIDLALKGKSNKLFEYEEAKEAWIRGSLLGATNPELIEDLMEDGMEKIDNKYSFSRDLRLRHLKAVSVDCFSVSQAEALARSISCRVCLIKASSSPFLEMGIRNFPSIIDVLKESAKSFEMHELEGQHHIHMEHADQVAQIAKAFIHSAT